MLKRYADPLRQPSEYPERLRSRSLYGNAQIAQLSQHYSYVALGMDDGSLAILDSDTLTPQVRELEHDAAITGIAWSDNASRLITYGEDWTFCLWDTVAKCVLAKHNLGFSPSLVIFDPDVFGRALVAYKLELFIADVPLAGESAATFPVKRLAEVTETAAGEAVSSAAFVRDGIVVGTTRGRLVVFHADGRLAHEQKQSARAHRAIAYSRVSNMLAVSSDDKVVRTFNIEDLEELDLLHKFSDMGIRRTWNSLAFSANGEYLYAASGDTKGDVTIWNPLACTLIVKLDGAKEPLQSLQFNEERTLLFGVGCSSGALFAWDAKKPDLWDKLFSDLEAAEVVEVPSQYDWDIPSYPRVVGLKQIEWTDEPGEETAEVIIPIDF